MTRAEDVWFWFIREHAARAYNRPPVEVRHYEPGDILKSLDRIHRQRLIDMDALLVLRHYGVRQRRPNAGNAIEARAAKVWTESLWRLDEEFRKRGFIEANA